MPAWALPQDGAVSGAHSSTDISRIERSVQTVTDNTPNPSITGHAPPQTKLPASHRTPEKTSPDLVRLDRDLLQQLGCLDPNGEISCSFAH